jgi:hypothetical protein
MEVTFDMISVNLTGVQIECNGWASFKLELHVYKGIHTTEILTKLILDYEAFNKKMSHPIVSIHKNIIANKNKICNIAVPYSGSYFRLCMNAQKGFISTLGLNSLGGSLRYPKGDNNTDPSSPPLCVSSIEFLGTIAKQKFVIYFVTYL